MNICQCCKENNAACLFEEQETCGECFANLTIINHRLSFFEQNGFMPMLNINPYDKTSKTADDEWRENFETGFD